MSFDEVLDILLLEAGSGDYQEAINDLEDLAILGDREAQNLLGTIYAEVMNRPDEGVRWLTRAARAGYSKAQYNLGYAFRYSDLSSEDTYADAAYWFDEAVKSGDMDAAMELGLMYQDGIGVDRNIIASRNLLREAAASEISYAHYYLGVSYLLYTPLNYEEALNYLRSAARMGVPEAYSTLAALERSEGRNDESDREAFELYLQGAILGNTESMLNVGNMYMNGVGVDINYEQAVYWLERASRNGNSSADNLLGVIHLDRNSGYYDERAAFEFFLKAAHRGNHAGAQNLSRAYCEGIGTAVNEESCEFWRIWGQR